ncbi:unnamed protein product [Rotaria sp. Silwood2]|nr:unnamed protein product [Rotaria sp. Silwood2]CAF3419503.1 unnamed protein product [Rotaria sp. Silwood2]CAF4312742.1 unnamed protein product [Rotaria sp. Silwood2]CAF4499002.1 unnamed protein product [Rotaria sp. Silwood2]
MAARMLEILYCENELQTRLNHLTNISWKKHDARMCLFPMLTIEDIRRYCFGSYQLKQAKSYILEHLKPSEIDPDDLEFIIELCEQHDDLVRVRFSSRHSTQKSYTATVQYDSDEEKQIQGWYCTCPNGARVLGCCPHIAALLWYLGVCRADTDDTGHPLSTQNLLDAVNDCIQYQEIEDDDEDEGAKYNLIDDQNGSDSDT